MKHMNKETLMQAINKSPTIIHFILKCNNRFKIGKNEFNCHNLHTKKNQIEINGENNRIDCHNTSFFRESHLVINGNNNHIVIEPNVQFCNGRIMIIGDHNEICIGENSLVQKTSFFIYGNHNEMQLGKHISAMKCEYHIEQEKNRLIISDGCTFHGRDGYPVHIALDEGTKVILEEDCMLSNGIQIRSSDSHSIIDQNGKRLNHAQDIHIGRHCWIGLGSIILKGCHIPNNSVVAAGAVCTKKYVEEGIVIAGNPAKVVKTNMNWDRKFID